MIERRGSNRVLLEICVATLEDAKTAELAGADRLELNSALGLGGLTPSLGLFLEIKEAVQLPVMAMIRPRPGGFDYGGDDFRVMLRDIKIAVDHGAEGIVCGVLSESGAIDFDRCRTLRVAIGDRRAIFHRAFDLTPDPFDAVESLIELGFDRVMTSGQEESAYNGIPLIRQLIDRVGNRIEILPAGGINRFTLNDILARTGCDQVHGSLREIRVDASASGRPRVRFGAAFSPPEDRFDTTSLHAASDLAARLKAFADARESPSL